jgi:hypothetical protein
MIINKQDSGHAAAPAKGKLMKRLVEPGAETNRIEP